MACGNFAGFRAIVLYSVLPFVAAPLAGRQAAPALTAQIKNAASGSATAPAQPTATTIQPTNKQAASIEAMLASADKQRAAVKPQAGLAAANATDSFFTTPWTTAATIPVPAVIAACDAIPEEELKPLVEDSAKAQDLKPELIRAVIRRESASYPCAISEKGALGLMQLMPDVAQQFGADPLDPKQNVQAGSRYLKQLITRYKGDTRLALAAYNAGPQLVDAQNKVPDIPETISYVDAILKDLKEAAPVTP